VPGQPNAATSDRPVAQMVSAEEPRLLASHVIVMPASFAFRCYGIEFEAAVVHDPEAAARLMVTGALGVMPFSAESPVARRYMHAVVDAGRELPYATITLSKKQSITVRGSMVFPRHPSPALIAAGTAAIVIAVKPVIDLVAACRAIGRTSAA
jgi:hypothetical protein